MVPLTLLLLSGGGHTGSNVMAALATRRQGLRLIATSDAPDEPALFAFDAVYLAPTLGIAAQDFELRLLEILSREAVDLIIPCRDEDVSWLAGLRERRPELAPRLLCGASTVAEVINDKWLSCQFALEHGLPFARTLPTGEGGDVAAFVAQHGLPLVLKPRRGANSRGVAILNRDEQVNRAMAKPGAVLQEFLGDRDKTLGEIDAMLHLGLPLAHDFMGEKHSIQLLLAPDGECVSLACTCNVMDGRISRRVSLDASPAARAIGEHCAGVFARAGWCGPLNVQCQRAPDGALRIHEFNARFTGATAARWALGIDEVGLALRAFTGRFASSDAGKENGPAAVRETLAVRAAPPEARAELARNGFWQANRRVY